MTDVLCRIIDSRDAGTGGGSASALAGAMAAGLAGMVARLSIGRGLPLADADYEALADEADGLSQALRDGADDDAAAYALVAAAYKLRRDDEEAATARRAAIGEALLVAARAPLENAQRSLRARELAAVLQGRSNAAAASDLGAAVLLADAAVRGCLLNVDVNLEALPESAAAAEVSAAATAVRRRHARLGAPLKEKA